MTFYQGKNILVTGGTGMIGRALLPKLLALGGTVTVASLDNPGDLPENVGFERVDLRDFNNCLSVCEGQDIVFNLVGVKGSPAMTRDKPASFFVPTITFSVNMMEAARRAGVKRYLFTSSVGVYQPADVFYEDDVWSTFPSENDIFAGWAKRMGELQARAYEIQHGWQEISIVRPANVYGPYDNFDPENAMVIPSLINRALGEEPPLVVWGDGSPLRDFIHARDVADGMIAVVEQGYNKPVNLGSGEGITIREVAETVADLTGVGQIVWDTDKPKGDAKRIMCTKRAESIGITPKVSIREGIQETIDWYKANKAASNLRYNAFTDPDYK